MTVADTIIALQTGVLATMLAIVLVHLRRIEAQRAYNAKRVRP